MGSTRIDQCLICSGTNLKQFIDLDAQPLANSFLAQPTDLPKYELKLNYCQDCTHCQLTAAVDPDLLYKDYKYVSGTTRTLKEHFRGIALRFGGTGREVLDIGCNDGSLLEQFIYEGCNVQGVDPAENLRPITTAKAIPVMVDYWNKETAKNFGDRKFDVITATNCLAHNSNPRDFVAACKSVLAPKGHIVLEFPYFGSTLDLNDFGQLYAEHHSYFTAHSFKRLAESSGLSVTATYFFPDIHGGTVRMVLMDLDTPYYCYSFQDMLTSEGTLFERFAKFSNDLDMMQLGLATVITSLVTSGKKVVAYGASAKSSTLFNLPFIREITRDISYIVDDSPLKQGLYCPGSNIRIDLPTALREEDPNELCILITAHNFKKEIAERLMAMGLDEAILVHYVPNIVLEKVKTTAK